MASAEQRSGLDIGLWYDLRNPPEAGRAFEDFYAEVLDQICRSEGLGFDSVWVSEHHFTDDGYTASPLVFLASVAARATRLRLGTNLMIPPLHNPVRLAEDAAALSILSGGRFDLGVSGGYREIEFEAFERSLKHRPSLMEETIQVLRRAWAGESIAIDGKRFHYPAVKVTPVPARAPRILMGANSDPARERAARIADGYLAPSEAALPMYLEALERQGRDPDDGSVVLIKFVVIDEDPEGTWARVGPMALRQINTYIGWGGFGPPELIPQFDSPEALLAGGAYELWDGPTAIAKLTELAATWPQLESVQWPALLPGETVEEGDARIEFAAQKVLPEVRSRVA